MPASDNRQERVDIVLRGLPKPVGVAGVEPGHPATDLPVGKLAAEAVSLEDTDHRLADGRLLVFDETGRKQRDLASLAGSRAACPSREPFENRTRSKVGRSRSRDPRDLLHARARAGFNLAVALTTGASAVETLPCKSVRASSRDETDDCWLPLNRQ